MIMIRTLALSDACDTSQLSPDMPVLSTMTVVVGLEILVIRKQHVVPDKFFSAVPDLPHVTKLQLDKKSVFLLNKVCQQLQTLRQNISERANDFTTATNDMVNNPRCVFKQAGTLLSEDDNGTRYKEWMCVQPQLLADYKQYQHCKQDMLACQGCSDCSIYKSQALVQAVYCCATQHPLS